jgi:hypothetical protein
MTLFVVYSYILEDGKCSHRWNAEPTSMDESMIPLIPVQPNFGPWKLLFPLLVWWTARRLVFLHNPATFGASISVGKISQFGQKKFGACSTTLAHFTL